MFLEFANLMRRKGYDYTTQMLAIGNDVDYICAYMAYIQLFMYDIPGIIKIKDTMTRELKRTLYTPSLKEIEYVQIEDEEMEEKEI